MTEAEMGYQGSEQQRRAIEANLAEAEFSTAQRDKLADKGHAMPDGSYPIRNASDLRNAIQAIGRAKNRAAAMAHIRKRAKALGLEKMLPSSWSVQESAASDAYNILHPHDRRGRWARKPFSAHIAGYPVHPRTGKFLPSGGSRPAAERRQEAAITHTVLKREAERLPLRATVKAQVETPQDTRRREAAIRHTALRREAARPADRVPLMRDRPVGRRVASEPKPAPKPVEHHSTPGMRNLDALAVDMFAQLENRRGGRPQSGPATRQRRARPTPETHPELFRATHPPKPVAPTGPTTAPSRRAGAPSIPLRADARNELDWARQENYDRLAHHRAAAATPHDLFASGVTRARPDMIADLSRNAPSKNGGRYVIHHATDQGSFRGQGRGPEYEITHRELHPEHHSAAGFGRSRTTGQIVAWRQVGPRKQGTRMVPVDVAHARDTGGSDLEFDWSKAVRLHANEDMGVSTDPHEWQALHGSTRPKTKGRSPVGPVPEDRQMPSMSRSELAAEQRAMRHRQPEREHLDAMRQGMADVGGHRDLIDAFATGTANEEQWDRAARFLTNSKAALKDGTHPWIANERDPIRMGESVRELRRVHQRIAAALAAHKRANRRSSR